MFWRNTEYTKEKKTMNNKLKILICMGIAISGIRAAKANPLAIAETRAEAQRIGEHKKIMHESTKKNKEAERALDKAGRLEAKAADYLAKADTAKQLAQRLTSEAVENSKRLETYFPDQGHSTGTALLIEKPRYEELEPYQRGS